MPDELEIQAVPPADCAQQLAAGACEMALIPAGALLDFKGISILPDFCIGADGPVQSVFIFSQQPIENIDTLILDRHSRSSNGLARILLQHYWQKSVVLTKAEGKHFDAIQGNTAGVVIGDKALKIKDNFAYVYDLSEYWKKMTGLPFAFAVWAFFQDKVSKNTLKKINQALALGVAQTADSALKWGETFGLTPEVATRYLTQDIHFHLTADRHTALQLYLELLSQLEEV